MHTAKGPFLAEQYALEALVAKSQLRVKVNKIGPRASGLGPHRMRKCPRPLGEGPSVSLVRRKSARIGRRSCSWVLENENGQRARGRGSHSTGEMVLAKEKVIWQRSACNRKQSSAHNKNRSAEVPTMNQIGLHGY